MDTLELALRVCAGVGLGAAIGIERQWRSKMAGLRTNALVSLGSALFVVMGAYAFAAGDPTRVAAQVASGIGFLGAGVILKQGTSISGLNTAATLWASAAVGSLAGAGMFAAAGAGTVAVIAANVLLRPLSRLLDRNRTLGSESGATEYRFEVRCRADAESEVRALVMDAIIGPEFTIRSVATEDLVSTDEIRIVAMVVTADRNDRAVESALAAVVTAPPVSAVRWTAEDLSGVD
ncbi:MgtC/SapB family protein [Mycobacterium sp. SMC-4]|uniref:MgtC/SapB family protein n=1 Tax=Mycobacterium sp. SMC-4 TaxID=2857059 RepID=UPI003CFD0C98